MARNGNRRPRRARIELVTPAPSADEAAAIAAAVERFLAETAPAPASAEPARSPWQRAALLEGIGARAGFGTEWSRPGSASAPDSG
jgi:hypothetical protein